jgi:hypothetical protein
MVATLNTYIESEFQGHLISILLLYKHSSYDYRVIFFMSKCVYIILGHSVYWNILTMHGPINVKNVGLCSKIFKLISTARLQRKTKVGNSGFVPPVHKHQEDGGLQAEKDGRRELLRTNCKTHVHPRTIWTQGLQRYGTVSTNYETRYKFGS